MSSISSCFLESSKQKELYFGHYKVDGVNISNAEFKQCRNEIPACFKKCGQYHPIVENVMKRR